MENSSTAQVSQDVLSRYLPHEIVSQIVTGPEQLSADALAPYIKELRNLLQRIISYTPRLIAGEQLANPEAGRVKGRMVHGALMFADVSGFTALSERLTKMGLEGAEEISRIINDLFTSLLEAVARYGGSLFKFGGDALTVLFVGAEHEARAVRAGLEMQAALLRFRNIQTRAGVFSLNMRVGIHGGDIFVAEVGAQDRIEIVVTGENVNITAEVEENTEPGTVFISAALYEEMRGEVDIAVEPSEHNLYWVRRLNFAPRPPEPPLTWPGVPDDPVATVTGLVARIEALRPYLVAGLYTKIEANPNRELVEGEFRLVTVLFANFYDFSHILHELGEENASIATSILGSYYDRMQEIITRYGGVVNKIDMYSHGDKLMAIFGAPRAYGDDHERATRAAIEMQQAMREFEQVEVMERTFSLSQKIGLNTGHVFAGNVGSPHRKEYSVMGDEVNLTARLMAAASEGQIVLSPSTYRLVRNVVEVNAWEPIRVKGKANPIPVYEVLRLSEARRGARLPSETTETGIRRGKLVERQDEFAQMAQCLETAIQGQSQILALVGGPGTGKTRLVEELAEQVLTPRGIPIYTEECQSYSQATPYFPFIKLFRAFFDLASDTPEADAVDSVLAKAHTICGDLARFVPLLGDILNLPLPENEVTRALTLEQRRERMFDLIVTMLKEEAHFQPFVMALEDLQWLDISSLELLNFIVPAIQEAPLLLILSYRPPLRHSWMTRENYNEIELRELSEAASIELAESMLAIPALPVSLRQFIYEKAQGNPFFVEEVVKSLTETGALQRVDEDRWTVTDRVENLVIPDTIQGVVMARIDRLEERSRHVLQVASVVGQQFRYVVLEGVYPERARLRQRLRSLSVVDLYMDEDTEADPYYTFKHITTHDVAYESLLYSRRRYFHHCTAEFMEGIYRDHLSEQYDALAYHYHLAETWQRALEYHLKAGEKAMRLYANKQAIDYFETALEIADKIDADTAEEQVKLHELLGDVRLIVGEFDGALANFARAREILGDVQLIKGEFDGALTSFAEARGLLETRAMSSERREHLARLCRKTSRVYELKGAYDDVFYWSQRGLSVLGDYESPVTAQIYIAMGSAYQRQGKYTESLEWCEKGLAMAQRLGQRSEMANALNILAIVRYRQEDVARAIEHWQQCLVIYRDIEDAEHEATTFNNLGIIYMYQGDWKEAIEHYDKSLEIFEKIGKVDGVAMVYINRAELLANMGNLDDAIISCENGLELFRKIGYPYGVISSLSILGPTKTRQGKYQEALECLEESLELSQQIDSQEGYAEIYRFQAEAYLGLGKIDEAQQRIELSLERAQALRRKADEGAALRVVGQVHHQRGDWLKATESLERSLKIAEEIGNQREVGTVLLNLALLYNDTATALNQPQKQIEAGAALHKAIEIFEQLDAKWDLEQARGIKEEHAL